MCTFVHLLLHGRSLETIKRPQKSLIVICKESNFVLSMHAFNDLYISKINNLDLSLLLLCILRNFVKSH